MSTSGKISTQVQVNDDTYDVNVGIPTTKPAVTDPYTLQIYNDAEVAKTPTTKVVPSLILLNAFYNAGSTATAPENVYLELSPPASILPSTDSFAVKSLSIEFATGAYGGASPTAHPSGAKGTKTVAPPQPPQQH